MKKLVFMAVIVSVFCVAGVASASLVDLTYMGMPSPLAVNITAPPLGTVNTSAGLETVKINGGPTINALCFEPQWSTQVGATAPYDLQTIPDGSTYKAAAWLLSQSG
jgi:hypothetical protein